LLPTRKPIRQKRLVGQSLTTLASAFEGATVTRHTYVITLKIGVLALVPADGSEAPRFRRRTPLRCSDVPCTTFRRWQEQRRDQPVSVRISNRTHQPAGDEPAARVFPKKRIA
jgi:hypothetical protein